MGLFYPSGSGIRDKFFRDPRSSTFYGEIPVILHFLQNPFLNSSDILYFQTTKACTGKWKPSKQEKNWFYCLSLFLCRIRDG
jgi:hypothetical protein